MVNSVPNVDALVAAAKEALASSRLAINIYRLVDQSDWVSPGWFRSVIDQEMSTEISAHTATYSFLKIRFADRLLISGPNDEPPRTWHSEITTDDETRIDSNLGILHWLFGAIESTPAHDGVSVACLLDRERAVANSDTPEQTDAFLRGTRDRAHARIWVSDGAISQFTLEYPPIKRRLRRSEPASRMFIVVEAGPTVPVLDLKPSDDHATFDKFTSMLLESWPGSDRVNYSEPPPPDLLELKVDGNGAKYKLD